MELKKWKIHLTARRESEKLRFSGGDFSATLAQTWWTAGILEIFATTNTGCRFLTDFYITLNYIKCRNCRLATVNVTFEFLKLPALVRHQTRQSCTGLSVQARTNRQPQEMFFVLRTCKPWQAQKVPVCESPPWPHINTKPFLISKHY